MRDKISIDKLVSVWRKDVEVAEVKAIALQAISALQEQLKEAQNQITEVADEPISNAN